MGYRRFKGGRGGRQGSSSAFAIKGLGYRMRDCAAAPRAFYKRALGVVCALFFLPFDCSALLFCYAATAVVAGWKKSARLLTGGLR